jgi:Na+-translocating ferredoxin:NAD+ oxidoreductase subunit D
MSKEFKAPFIKAKASDHSIMRDVLIALMPVSVMAVVHFGIKSLIMMILGVASAVFFEYAYQRVKKKEITIKDLSAAVTGLLVALSLPANAPLWLVVFGTAVAILLIKQLPGGIGKNTFNPAVFSRVLIKILFSPLITDWVQPGTDAVSTATPLSFIGDGAEAVPAAAPSFYDAFMGNIGGNVGETVKWAIILGFAYLVIRKVISFWVPVSVLAGLFLTMLLFGESDPFFGLYHVITGTAMFAAVFMVTDYTSGPLNKKARIYYALLIGILTGVLRYGFALPGGVGIAILIMNLLAPLLDSYCTPRVFGHRGRILPISPPLRR